MNLVVDTSVVISVVTNEPHKKQLVKATKGADLIAPASLHWEIGNAFSAMFKRGKISLDHALEALMAYRQVPIRFSEVSLDETLEVSSRLNVYAYDAYFIVCALKHKAPLLSLDDGLLDAARNAGVSVEEVQG